VNIYKNELMERMATLMKQQAIDENRENKPGAMAPQSGARVDG
jgi:hypothetical protein